MGIRYDQALVLETALMRREMKKARMTLRPFAVIYERGHASREPIAVTQIDVVTPRRGNADRAIGALNTLAFWGLALALCAILGLRPIGDLWDDSNYLQAFQPTRFTSTNWYHYLIDEPLWSALTQLLGSFLDPVTSYRVVLFSSPAIFFLSANRIAGGDWLRVRWHSWMILAAFVLDTSIGARLYISAIRQGFATSTFLLVAALGWPIIGALAAGMIHTSLLVSAAVVGIANSARRYPALAGVLIVAIGLWGVATFLGLSPTLDDDFDLGRRTGVYTGVTGLNLLGDVVTGSIWTITLLLLQKTPSLWRTAAMVFVPVALVLAMANGGFERLFLDVDVFLLLAIACAIRTPQARLAGLVWLSASVALALWEASKGLDIRDSWLGQWKLALALKF